MKLAYLIITHKNPEQVANLVQTVCRPEDLALIHCDLKSGSGFQERIQHALRASHPSNVRFATQRRVNWGGFSVTAVEADGIRQLLSWKDDWDYLINLSGQCMPTKSPAALADFLAAHRGANFIDCVDLQTDWKSALYRLKTFALEWRGRLLDTRIPRRALKGVRFFGGSAWFILSRAFCEYLTSSSVFTRMFAFARYTQIPDELLFQTTIMNSPFRDSVVGDAKRLIMWPPEASPHPLVLTTRDWPRLMEADHYFARKFDTAIDADVIARLTEYVQPNASRPLHQRERPCLSISSST